jgi:fructuronate reductase
MTGSRLAGSPRQKLSEAGVRLTPRSAAEIGLSVTPCFGGRPAGIVHPGSSNFHRAHQAVFTARALDLDDGPWGVVGVARQSREVLDAMIAQDLSYSVLTLEGAATDVEAVQVHEDVMLATADPDRVVSRLADPTTKIITITVTEAGCTFDPRTGGLDAARPELAADLTGRPPLTTVGQLAGALRRRHRAGGEPVTVMSCDNLVGNGALLRSLVEQFLRRTAPGGEAGELIDWCRSQVAFPGSMVDRIVPCTADQHRKLVRARTGLIDLCPVPAEPFSMWVIEDSFATPRPCCDRVGGILSDDVHGYEVLKIRLLNGTHSLIAYLGLLVGARRIDEAIADADIRGAAEAFLDEMSDTVATPEGISLTDYRASLIRRFGNSSIAHRTSQVGSDGSLKVPARIPDPVAIRSASGRRSPMSALLAAVFVRVLTDPDATGPTVSEGLRDPALAVLNGIGERHPREKDRVAAVLIDSGVFPAELGNDQVFLDECGELAETCRRAGVRAAIRAALQQVTSDQRTA